MLDPQDTLPAADEGAADPTPLLSDVPSANIIVALVKLWVTWHSKRTSQVQWIADVTWA